MRVAIACSAPLLSLVIGRELQLAGLQSEWILASFSVMGLASVLSAATALLRSLKRDQYAGSSHWLDNIVRALFMIGASGPPIIVHFEGLTNQAVSALLLAQTLGTSFFALIAMQFTRRAAAFMRMFAVASSGYVGALALAGESAASIFAVLWTVNIVMVVQNAARSRHELEQVSDTNLVAAHTDSMTGLLNRDGLINAWQYRGTDGPASMIAVDLNKFKEVNDHWGHATGDTVLKVTGARLREALGNDALIARLGGDEFAAVLPLAIDSDELNDVLPHVCAHLAKSINADGPTVRVSASIGAASVDRSAGLEVALSNADYAMFEAKRSTENEIVIFDLATQHFRDERSSLERRVLVALAEQHFEWWAQPVVNGATGDPMAVELLVRWPQPDGTILAPDAFLPTLAQAGLLPELGRQSLATAGWLLRAWRNDSELRHIGVQVNVNGDHLAGPIVADICSSVEEQDRDRLGLEVVETDLVADIVTARQNLLQCVDMGCLIFIDDFGSGYSSLALLNSLPVTHLKIDRSLITDLGQSPRQTRLVAAIRQLTTELMIGLVAEGVETAAEQQVLLDLDVLAVQGWLHARPIRPADIDFEVRRLHRAAASKSTNGAPHPNDSIIELRSILREAARMSEPSELTRQRLRDLKQEVLAGPADEPHEPRPGHVATELADWPTPKPAR